MMTWCAAALLLALAAIQTPDRYEVTGPIPVSLGPPSRILWLPADGIAGEQNCELTFRSTWRCRLPAGSPGVVVVAADPRLVSFPIGVANVDTPLTIASWGRLLLVQDGGATPDDLRDLRVIAWKPERSAARPQTQRLTPIQDSAVHVSRLSQSAFWLTGEPLDPDAYVLIEGAAFASKRLSTPAIASGPPDVPFYVSLTPPFSMTGRVEDRATQNVDGADVELFEPLTMSEDRGRSPGQPPVLIRRAKARSSADGTFVFDRLEAGSWYVVARHPSRGRGTASVSVVSEPLVIRLTPPARLTGRVLQRALPVAGARIRFVPDPTAWMASVDPRDHLVEDTYSGLDGRFSLTLPLDRTGTVQIAGPDNASRHFAVPSHINADEVVLGDVTLSGLRRATVRLSDPAMCELFATGPLGTLGLATVRATGASSVYWFDLPEPGAWALSAECDGLAPAIEPPLITVAPDGPEPTAYAHLVRSAPDH